MKREKASNGIFKRMIRRLVNEGGGQVMAMFALALPVFIGAGALAVDMGYLYTARNALQNAADAAALAGVTGIGAVCGHVEHAGAGRRGSGLLRVGGGRGG